MKPYGFCKAERLCSKKSIDSIFEGGISVFAYPVKAAFSAQDHIPTQPPLQALFVVPKKKFKRAVHRNRLRRRMREAYRLNKQILEQWCLSNGVQLRIAFIYVSSEEMQYSPLKDAIVKTLKLIMESTYAGKDKGSSL